MFIHFSQRNEVEVQKLSTDFSLKLLRISTLTILYSDINIFIINQRRAAEISYLLTLLL